MPTMPRRVVILFSDTGGGHRSLALAIREALESAHGADARVTLVEGLTEYTRFPLNRLPAWYPWMAGPAGPAYGAVYRITDRTSFMRFAYALVWRFAQKRFIRLLRDHPADVAVSVHPFLTPLAVRARRFGGPPVVAVLNEFRESHAAWFVPGPVLFVVASDANRARALRFVPPSRIRLIGPPVSIRFRPFDGDKADLKRRLGWKDNRPALLLTGGGDGMGPVLAIVRAIADSGLPCVIVVVAGRNQALQRALLAERFSTPLLVYGFTDDMPDLMRAADVLVGKAGPVTMCEAMNTGLPLVLYGYLPGQEEGNVPWAVEKGIALWAPGPNAVVAALRRWIGPDAEPGALSGASAAALRLGRPNSAREVADAIWAVAGEYR